MTRRFMPLVAAAAFYATIYAAFAWWRTEASASNPHAFMKDPSRCGECHLESRPESGRPYIMMNFRKDITGLCISCHPLQVAHPVDIAPGKGRGKDLPLDTDGTMTCITCHAPHSQAYSNLPHSGRTLYEKARDTVFPFLPGKFRTLYLRIPTVDGELCESCHALANTGVSSEVESVDPSQYSGAKSCAGCHPSEYAQWKKTPHARMLRNPRRNPDAILADMNGSSPLPSSEIAYVLGSRNVQRFISKKGESMVVRTPIWLIRGKKWNLSYWREMDWMKTCAGCHTTGFNPYMGQYAEESVSCEACHGPGKRHVSTTLGADIVNPRKITESRRNMICESCHTTGHDVSGEYRFPVGYTPGKNLLQFFVGLTPKPGQDDQSFKGDGSYADRKAQYLFWRSRMLLVEGETCDLCKNFRVARKEAASNGPRKMSAQEFCLSCHDGTIVPLPPQHGPGFTGDRPCLSCHPPVLTAKGETSIHDHRYIPSEALEKDDTILPTDFRGTCFRCHSKPGKGAPET